MSVQEEHSKSIIAAARKILKPAGFRQKGSSRTFLSDEGLWSIIVEFQPSSWSRGSYLNVGAHWFWKGRDHITFDYGHRVQGQRFVDLESSSGLDEKTEALALRALEEAEKLRALFPDISHIADVLSKGTVVNVMDNGWGIYSAGIAYGLVENFDAARLMFDKIMQAPAPHAWMVNRQEDTMRLSKLSFDRNVFLQEIYSRISSSRSSLKLPDMDVQF